MGLNDDISVDIEEIYNGGKVCLHIELPNLLPFSFLSSLSGHFCTCVTLKFDTILVIRTITFRFLSSGGFASNLSGKLKGNLPLFLDFLNLLVSLASVS